MMTTMTVMTVTMIKLSLIFVALVLVGTSFTTPVYSQIQIPGDANSDCRVDGQDYAVWRSRYPQVIPGGVGVGDFNEDGSVDGIDYSIWRQNYGRTCSSVSPTVIPSPAPTLGITPGYVSNAICNPDLGSRAFTKNVTNKFMPFSLWQDREHILYNPANGERVRMRVQPNIKLIPGADGVDPVEALVLEEYETINGNHVETSYNWFAQTVGGDRPGTVCYFGEYVTTYPDLGHAGSWEAGQPNARAGIMMLPNPVVRNTYLIEDAQAYGAYEDGIVMTVGESFTTPSGTYQNTVYIEEANHTSFKRYAPGVGMIYDSGMSLITQASQNTSLLETTGVTYNPNSSANLSKSQASKVKLTNTSLLGPSQGWIALRMQMGFSASATTSTFPKDPIIWDLSESDPNGFMVYYNLSQNPSERTFHFERHFGGSGQTLASDPMTFSTGAYKTIIAAWTPTQIKLSIDGSPFKSLQTSVQLPALSPLFIGSTQVQGAGRQPNSDYFWVAAGSGTLTDANASTIHTFGNTDQAKGSFPGNPTFFWGANDNTYQ